MKYALSILFLLSLTALVACSDSAGTTEQSPYFKAERIEIPEGYELSYMRLEVTDGSLFVTVTTPYDYETKSQDIFELAIDLESGEYTLTPEENAVGLRSLYSMQSERGGRYEVTGILGNMMSYDSVTLTELDKNGETLRELDCAELFETDLSKLRANLAGEGNIFTVRTMFEHEGRLHIVANIGVVSVDGDGGKRLWQSDKSIAAASYTAGKLILIGDDAVEFDLAKFTQGERLKLPEGFSGKNIFALDGYELATRTADGIFGFNRNENGELVRTLVCDFNSVDVNSASLQAFTAVSPSEFWLIEMHSVTFEHTLWRLKMIPADEYVEKTELTIALYPTDRSEVRQAVTDFNRQSDKYRFRVKLYASEDGGISSEDLAPVKTRFAADIASGEVPDIVVMENFLSDDADDFEAQGLFTDLYALMDAAGYSRENILACQRESFERESPRTGETYLPYLALHSSAKTLLNDPADFEGRLTLEALLDMQDEGIKPMKVYGKWSSFRFLTYELERFIGEDGVPHFDSPIFLRMLDATKSDLKFDSEADGIFGEYVISQPSKLIGDFVQNGIAVPNFAGYPDTDGTGVELVANEIIGITEGCEHKEAAFELLEILMTDEYQFRSMGIQLPMLTVSSFERYLDESFNRYYYISKTSRMSASSVKPFNNERLEQLREELGEGVYIEVGDEFIEFIRELVLSARSEPAINTDVMYVVYEEYTAAHRTSEEIAEVLNDRIEIIWNEKRDY